MANHKKEDRKSTNIRIDSKFYTPQRNGINYIEMMKKHFKKDSLADLVNEGLDLLQKKMFER